MYESQPWESSFEAKPSLYLEMDNSDYAGDRNGGKLGVTFTGRANSGATYAMLKAQVDSHYGYFHRAHSEQPLDNISQLSQREPARVLNLLATACERGSPADSVARMLVDGLLGQATAELAVFNENVELLRASIKANDPGDQQKAMRDALTQWPASVKRLMNTFEDIYTSNEALTAKDLYDYAPEGNLSIDIQVTMLGTMLTKANSGKSPLVFPTSQAYLLVRNLIIRVARKYLTGMDNYIQSVTQSANLDDPSTLEGATTHDRSMQLLKLISDYLRQRLATERGQRGLPVQSTTASDPPRRAAPTTPARQTHSRPQASAVDFDEDEMYGYEDELQVDAVQQSGGRERSRPPLRVIKCWYCAGPHPAGLCNAAEAVVLEHIARYKAEYRQRNPPQAGEVDALGDQLRDSNRASVDTVEATDSMAVQYGLDVFDARDARARRSAPKAAAAKPPPPAGGAEDRAPAAPTARRRNMGNMPKGFGTVSVQPDLSPAGIALDPSSAQLNCEQKSEMLSNMLTAMEATQRQLDAMRTQMRILLASEQKGSKEAADNIVVDTVLVGQQLTIAEGVIGFIPHGQKQVFLIDMSNRLDSGCMVEAHSIDGGLQFCDMQGNVTMPPPGTWLQEAAAPIQVSGAVGTGLATRTHYARGTLVFLHEGEIRKELDIVIPVVQPDRWPQAPPVGAPKLRMLWGQPTQIEAGIDVLNSQRKVVYPSVDEYGQTELLELPLHGGGFKVTRQPFMEADLSANMLDIDNMGPMLRLSSFNPVYTLPDEHLNVSLLEVNMVDVALGAGLELSHKGLARAGEIRYSPTHRRTGWAWTPPWPDDHRPLPEQAHFYASWETDLVDVRAMLGGLAGGAPAPAK